ncbi:MAG TPA: tetratricopeptide repeat protein [Methylomirabilota bacterium]|nr:tetratricopeptide repeat protein [Methylomirabilota bacterium]
MTIADRYGLPISTSSATAAASYQEGMDRLLSWGSGADEAFAAALVADGDFALAHAGLALWSFFLGDGQAAREAIARARQHAAGATRRERQHVEALGAIVAGETARGLALVDAHVVEFPRDALLVNQASSSIGFGGRADREAERLAFVERLASAYGDDWWFQSALAFTYHEVGRLEESRRLSERSLEQYPANANASHNIAHVCFETSDHDEGVAFLEDWLAGYDRRAPYHCHLAWHLALFELQRGQPERALAIYDRDIADSSNARLTVMDGAALLWRFALYGGHREPLPWRPLAEVATRVARPGFVFGDIHAALAYAGSGDEAALDRLIDGLRALDAKGHPIAGCVALPLVLGIAAFAAGDHAGALGHLEPIDGEIHRMGGSHAQWEVFEETMVVCYLRLGRHGDARRLLRRRLERRPSRQDLKWLSQAETAIA